MDYVFLLTGSIISVKLFVYLWDFVSSYEQTMEQIRSIKGSDDVIFK